MIFGALILGLGIGFVAMAVAIVTGASLFAAFLAYWISALVGTLLICGAKMLLCKAGPTPSASADSSG